VICVFLLSVIALNGDFLCGEGGDADTCDVATVVLRSPIASAAGIGWGVFKHVRSKGGFSHVVFTAIGTLLAGGGLAAAISALYADHDDEGVSAEVENVVRCAHEDNAELFDTEPETILLALGKERIRCLHALCLLTETDLRGKPFDLPLLAARALLQVAAAAASATAATSEIEKNEEEPALDDDAAEDVDVPLPAALFEERVNQKLEEHSNPNDETEQ
jgi:hypothetical protein